MLFSCLKHRKDTESKISKVTNTKSGWMMLSSKCAVCDSEKIKIKKSQVGYSTIEESKLLCANM